MVVWKDYETRSAADDELMALDTPIAERSSRHGKVAFG